MPLPFRHARYPRSFFPAVEPTLTPEVSGPFADDIERQLALGLSGINAWFQPQISTHTGDVSGFEAQAYWLHPSHGCVPARRFLQTRRDQRQTGHIGQKILRDSLTALRYWDTNELKVPQVTLKCSPEVLCDPKLVDRFAWELDRYGVEADRLAIEIPGTTLAVSPDDLVARTMHRLAKMGCRIDLGEFGNDHAAISFIRRFTVHRLKIDPSLVRGIDKDMDQQRKVDAIQALADDLDLETLAEPVGNAGEHSILAQLGCHHVQGFGLGHPMPLDETLSWIATHRSNLTCLPRIDQTAG